MHRTFALLVVAMCSLAIAADSAPIARKLPPAGVPIPREEQQKLEAELAKVQARIKAMQSKPELADLLADVQIYEKAVRYALINGEFYAAKPKAGAKPPAKEAPPRGIAYAHDNLKAAAYRLDLLERGEHPWTTAKGQIVRGYISEIDGSAQPYGLEIPPEVDLAKPAPLLIWLHGRGDDSTDLYFVKGRDGGKRGELQPKGVIVLHAFGRQCVGYKSAGEIDVFEAIASAQKRYKIDENRIVLAGFSMGGAGTWHVGAHYADHFCLIHPGAGFIDVRRYQNADPAKTPFTERTLWGVYDVPDYVHNLFNTPVISYSGQNDKQRTSATIMAEVFKANGHELTQYIGPNVEHKWLPLPDMLKAIDEQIRKGRDAYPKHVQLQTKTLRYNKMFWVEVLGLGEHWSDAQVDAKFVGDDTMTVTTRNVVSLKLHAAWPVGKNDGDRIIKLTIDGKSPSSGMFPGKGSNPGRPAEIEVRRKDLEVGFTVVRMGATWDVQIDELPNQPTGQLRKTPGLQGPIDDAFMAPFLFVAPSGKSASPAVQKWVESEMKHQQDRWRELMRGDVRIKKDSEVTPEDIKQYNLICWGDATSNKVIAQMAAALPATWNGGKLVFNGKSYDAATHVPALIYPNPLNASKYVVLNSGLTFREAHDGTNSLQNPKIGDWAILNIATPPSAVAPAAIEENGFFDEAWKVKPPGK
jgi:acetyl esterase/lipase